MASQSSQLFLCLDLQICVFHVPIRLRRATFLTLDSRRVQRTQAMIDMLDEGPNVTNVDIAILNSTLTEQWSQV